MDFTNLNAESFKALPIGTLIKTDSYTVRKESATSYRVQDGYKMDAEPKFKDDRDAVFWSESQVIHSGYDKLKVVSKPLGKKDARIAELEAELERADTALAEANDHRAAGLARIRELTAELGQARNVIEAVEGKVDQLAPRAAELIQRAQVAERELRAVKEANVDLGTELAAARTRIQQEYDRANELARRSAAAGTQRDEALSQLGQATAKLARIKAAKDVYQAALAELDA